MSLDLNETSKTIKNIVHKMASNAKGNIQGIKSSFISPEKLREQNPYSYEDKSFFNNAQTKMLNTKGVKNNALVDEFYQPPIAKPTKIPIPPKAAEVYTQQIQPKMQQQREQVSKISLAQQPQILGEQVPKPSPTNAPGVPVYFNIKKYDVDNGGDGNIVQPPQEVYELAAKYFQGDDVEKAIITSLFESNYNPKRNNANKNGKVPDTGEDRGLMQINEHTFRDYMRRMPNTLAQFGIASYDDMWNADKNMAMASIIHKYQGWSGWYGAADNGYNIYDSDEIYQRARNAGKQWKATHNPQKR